MPKLNIPFYPNTEDDTHCFQAVLKSILKYYFPEKEYTWEELEQISNKPPGKWSWEMAGLVFLKRLGLEVKNVRVFDYPAFIERGEEYLIELWGKEAGEASIEHGDTPRAQEDAKIFIQEITPENRPANYDELIKLFQDGYLIVCNINSYGLDNEPGFAGHFVLITDIDENSVTMHDPGLPPHPNRKVDKATFLRAWYFSTEKEANYMAFKK